MVRNHHDVLPVGGCDVQLGLLLSMLDDGTQEWRVELGEVGEDALVWQPDAAGHSIGGVLLHNADVEAHWLHFVAAAEPRSPEELKTLLSEEIEQYAGRWPTPPRRPLAWYYEQQDRVRQRTHVLVRRLGRPDLAVERKNITFTLRWMLHHVIGHEAYHSGQAVLLALQHERRHQA